MIKVTVQGRWKSCQYCKRTIFTREKAYKIKGLGYYVCKECIAKGKEAR